MLVLTRKKEERLLIKLDDQECWLTVCDLRHDKVILGFEAPREITIHRQEVVMAIEREKSKNGNDRTG